MEKAFNARYKAFKIQNENRETGCDFLSRNTTAQKE